MAKTFEHRISVTAGSACSLLITDVDDELTVTLNGTEIRQLKRSDGNYANVAENIGGKLQAGINALVLTLVNYGDGGPEGFNPAGMAAELHYGTDKLSLNASSGSQNAHLGLFAQYVILIQS